ncbi:hypothetical protein Hanom_Chr14g01296241 [Helianthus anomalus]
MYSGAPIVFFNSSPCKKSRYIYHSALETIKQLYTRVDPFISKRVKTATSILISYTSFGYEFST